jgi:hypothetical protein
MAYHEMEPAIARLEQYVDEVGETICVA